MKKNSWRNNYPIILLGAFLVIWVFLAISPIYRGIWIAENIPTILFVGLLIVTYKKFRFSNFSYTLFFIFMVLHSIGAYYSYTGVPLFDFIQNEFDLSRNHYDRVIHFLFGLMFFVPIYEFVSRKLNVKKFWGLFLAFSVLTAMKGGYEVLEYGYLIVTRGSELIGTNYIGMQGDQWDAQKDIFLGMLGGAVAWCGFLIKNQLSRKN